MRASGYPALFALHIKLLIFNSMLKSPLLSPVDSLSHQNQFILVGVCVGSFPGAFGLKKLLLMFIFVESKHAAKLVFKVGVY